MLEMLNRIKDSVQVEILNDLIQKIEDDDFMSYHEMLDYLYNRVDEETGFFDKLMEDLYNSCHCKDYIYYDEKSHNIIINLHSEVSIRNLVKHMSFGSDDCNYSYQIIISKANMTMNADKQKFMIAVYCQEETESIDDIPEETFNYITDDNNKIMEFDYKGMLLYIKTLLKS